MAYAIALSQAWSQLESSTKDQDFTVSFLNDRYSVQVKDKRVSSLSCNVAAKDHYSILILHYLCQKIKGLPPVAGEWISFKELPGGQAYYPTFKKRVPDKILSKYQDHPQALWELNRRFPARKEQLADVSIVLEAFEAVPILITFWKADDEFGPQANLLFDKNINQVFCTEDIVVLAEVIAHNI